MGFFTKSCKQNVRVLPSNWPSPLHNKCSQPDCRYPNPPQVAAGRYDCQGVPHGFFCEGTYTVSSRGAEAASEFFRREFEIERQRLKAERLQNVKWDREARREMQNKARAHAYMTQGVVLPQTRAEQENRRQEEKWQQQKQRDQERHRNLGRRDAVKKRLGADPIVPVPEYRAVYAKVKTSERIVRQAREDELARELYPGYRVPQRWI